MALILKDRVKEITTTTGTGDISLGGADSTFEAFSSYMADGDTTYYVIATQESGVDEWEVGIGTWNTGNTLSRTTILAGSNGTSAVNFGTGDKSVFMSYPASKAVYLDGNGDIDINGGTIDGTAIGSSSASSGAFTSLSASGNVDLEGYIDMNPIAHPTHAEGRVYYDSAHKTLSYQSDISDVEHELGIEEHVRVYNNSGSTIAKGKPVYWSGNQNDVPTIGLGNATSESKYNVQGLTAGEIANNSYGYVIVSGFLDGIDTSALSAGDNFFVGLTDGAVQNASPTYPNYPMCLGWVIKSDASTGIVLVNQQNHSFNSFRVRTDAHIGGDLIVAGDLTVTGTQTTTSSNNVELGASFQYLNAGDTIGEAGTTFTGSGLDDAYFAGHYTGTASTTYYVRIDATGTPDTFEWSKDNFSTTEATGVAITGSDQDLDNGIKINFGATTGHTSSDVWSGTATPANVDTGFFTNYNTGTSGTGYTHTGMFWDASASKWVWLSEYDPEPEGTINLADASTVYATVKAGTFEGDLSGDVTGNVTGTASSASALATARNIGGVSFDGTADINLPGVNTTGNQDTTGNAATATTLETARTIQLSGDVTGSVSFDGSADVSITAAVQDDSHAHVISNVDGLQTALDAKADETTTITAGDYLTGGGDLSANRTLNVDATSLNTASKVVARDASGNFTAGTITAALSGNATTATTLETARDISLTGAVTGSVSFDGSGNVSIATTATSDPTLTLAGDASGSATFTDLGNATLTVTVADDSHNHIISNIDGLQTALDGKLGTTAKAADSELLDGIDSGSFLRSDANDTYTGQLSLGSTSSRIDGSDGFPLVQVNSNRAYFGSTSRGVTTLASNSSTGLKANVSGTDYTVWHAGNDGSGSGLDADTVDGIQASSFLRSDADDTSSGNITISNATPTLTFTDTDNNYDATIQGLSGSLVLTADSGAEFGTETIQFKTGGAEAMRIDSSGNVGIGTSATLNNKLVIGFADGDGGGIEFRSASYTPLARIVGFDGGGSGNLRFYMNNGSSAPEVMRLDANGNLLVGTTNLNLYQASAGSTADNGVVWYEQYGFGTFSRYANDPLILNRTGTDGGILQLRKNGAPVGSIGTSSVGNFIIYNAQSSHVGLEFGSPNIMPTNNSGVLTDSGAALGSSSYRFSDLYLSGTVQSNGALSGTTTGYNFISGGNATNDGSNIFVYGSAHASAANTTIFRNGSTETMRIDSSGNLLVGITNTSSHITGSTIAGFSYNVDSFMGVSRASNIVAYFNRLSTDGNIMQFRKDGTVMGSIGARDSEFYFVGASAGVRIGSDNLSPTNGIGSLSDGAFDLGDGSSRYRNIYLSGDLSDGTGNTISVAELVSGGGGGIDPLNVVTATDFATTNAFGIGTSTVKVPAGLSNTIYLGHNININSDDQDFCVGVGSAVLTSGRHLYSTAVGFASLSRNPTSSAYRNTAVGAFSADGIYSGDDNVCIGYNSDNFSNAASYGVAIGSGSRGNDRSVAVGYQAYASGSSSGYYNVSIGYRAQYDNDGADFTTAIGYETNYNGGTGGSQTFIGAYAGRQQSSGSFNVAVGAYALYYDLGGSQNTAVGSNAAYGQRGSNNTLIGYTAGRPTSENNYTNTNVICLGHEAYSSSTTATNEITLGNSSISTLRCNTTSISSLSDERDKTDIQDLNWGLDFINDLRPVSFTWNRRDGTMGATKQVGFIAQEVHEVEMNHSSTEYTNMVNYENPSKLELAANQSYPILVKAVQELSAKVEELEARLAQLEGN